MSLNPLGAVTLDADQWMTDQQAAAFERALLPRISPEASGSLDAAFRLAETVCLDTALLGMVLAHESGGYVNGLYESLAGWSAKMDAGWPSGWWLPPAALDVAAEAVLRSRLRPGTDPDEAVEWAQWQLGNWWQLAALFLEGAEVETIEDSGMVRVVGGVTRAGASGASTGELIYADLDSPAEHEPRCAAKWDLNVVGAFGIEVQDRQCILVPPAGDSLCRLHAAAGR